MFSPRLLILSAMLCTAACAPAPEWYQPPIQRSFHPDSEPRAVGSLVTMESPQVDTYIVGGILTTEPGARWRWAHQRPELRFQLTETKNQNFFMDLVIADSTFKETGPVTIRFFLDGKLFSSVRYDSPGEKHFETPVSESFLTARAPVVLAAEIDKVYVSPTDGVKLGFLLIRAGFK